MRDDSHLENLFDKLINEKLSGAEMTELSQYLTESSASGDTDKYFQNIWDISPGNDVSMHSELLHQIHRKSGISTSGQGNRTPKTIAIRITGYAAVIALAFCFSWLLNNRQISQKSSEYSGLKEDNEVVVAYGSRSKIRLPDGSVVNLNSGSKLVYPAAFEQNNRYCDLEGEAHFMVKPDALHPFFVNVSEIVIKVTGTAFNVKSYPESNVIETILLSGTLEIFEKNTPDNGGDVVHKPLKLKPNQEAIYIRDFDKFTKDDQQELRFESSDAILSRLALLGKRDIQPMIAWNDDKLIFNNERFEDLAIKLERWYNVRITINSRELKNERFTGTFEKESIEQVLEALRIAESFEYTIVKNEIMIFEKQITNI